MNPLFFWGEGMMLGLDPLFILGSRQRGAPLWCIIPSPKGSLG